MRYSTLHAHYFTRLFRFVFLAVLASGVMITPFRIAAQAAAPTTKADAGSQAQAQGAAKPEAANKQENEDDRFRHTALVQATAKVLNLPVETTARSLEIINFAIIFLAIAIPLGRFLPKVIRKRSQTLSHNIESARKMTEDANARLSAVEAKLATLGDEIAKFRAEVERESLQDEARIKAAIEEESVRIVAAAEQEIGVAAAQAKRGLRHFATDLAIEQAAKQLILTPETDRALIAEFVGDIAHAGADKGGQN